MMGWRDEFKVHPAANKLPMLGKKALYELGEDIKANDLKSPIVLWHDSNGDAWLIDGQNRLEAMERAGLSLEADRACVLW